MEFLSEPVEHDRLRRSTKEILREVEWIENKSQQILDLRMKDVEHVQNLLNEYYDETNKRLALVLQQESILRTVTVVLASKLNPWFQDMKKCIRTFGAAALESHRNPFDLFVSQRVNESFNVLIGHLHSFRQKIESDVVSLSSTIEIPDIPTNSNFQSLEFPPEKQEPEQLDESPKADEKNQKIQRSNLSFRRSFEENKQLTASEATKAPKEIEESAMKFMDSVKQVVMVTTLYNEKQRELPHLKADFETKLFETKNSEIAFTNLLQSLDFSVADFRESEEYIKFSNSKSKLKKKSKNFLKQARLTWSLSSEDEVAKSCLKSFQQKLEMTIQRIVDDLIQMEREKGKLQFSKKPPKKLRSGTDVSVTLTTFESPISPIPSPIVSPLKRRGTESAGMSPALIPPPIAPLPPITSSPMTKSQVSSPTRYSPKSMIIPSGTNIPSSPSHFPGKKTPLSPQTEQTTPRESKGQEQSPLFVTKKRMPSPLPPPLHDGTFSPNRRQTMVTPSPPLPRITTPRTGGGGGLSTPIISPPASGSIVTPTSPSRISMNTSPRSSRLASPDSLKSPFKTIRSSISLTSPRSPLLARYRRTHDWGECIKIVQKINAEAFAASSIILSLDEKKIGKLFRESFGQFSSYFASEDRMTTAAQKTTSELCQSIRQLLIGPLLKANERQSPPGGQYLASGLFIHTQLMELVSQLSKIFGFPFCPALKKEKEEVIIQRKKRVSSQSSNPPPPSKEIALSNLLKQLKSDDGFGTYFSSLEQTESDRFLKMLSSSLLFSLVPPPISPPPLPPSSPASLTLSPSLSPAELGKEKKKMGMKMTDKKEKADLDPQLLEQFPSSSSPFFGQALEIYRAAEQLFKLATTKIREAPSRCLKRLKHRTLVFTKSLMAAFQPPPSLSSRYHKMWQRLKEGSQNLSNTISNSRIDRSQLHSQYPKALLVTLKKDVENYELHLRTLIQTLLYLFHCTDASLYDSLFILDEADEFEEYRERVSKEEIVLSNALKIQIAIVIREVMSQVESFCKYLTSYWELKYHYDSVLCLVLKGSDADDDDDEDDEDEDVWTEICKKPSLREIGKRNHPKSPKIVTKQGDTLSMANLPLNRSTDSSRSSFLSARATSSYSSSYFPSHTHSSSSSSSSSHSGRPTTPPPHPAGSAGPSSSLPAPPLSARTSQQSISQTISQPHMRAKSPGSCIEPRKNFLHRNKGVLFRKERVNEVGSVFSRKPSVLQNSSFYVSSPYLSPLSSHKDGSLKWVDFVLDRSFGRVLGRLSKLHNVNSHSSSSSSLVDRERDDEREGEEEGREREEEEEGRMEEDDCLDIPKKCNMNQLVILLTPELGGSVSHRVIQHVVLTFHMSFCSSIQLVKKLFQRFHVPKLLGLSEHVVGEIRLQCAIVLLEFLKRAIYFFDIEENLKEEIWSFLELFRDPKLQDVAESIKRYLKKLEKEEESHLKWLNTINPSIPLLPPQSLPAKADGLNRLLLYFSTEEIARQLTLAELELFKSIEPKELLDCAWSVKKLYYRGPSVRRYMFHLNRLGYWFATLVMLQTEEKLRAQVIENIIDVGHHLLKLQNFSTLMAVIAGLSLTAVHRLKKTFDLVGAAEKEKLDSLVKIMHPDRSYAAYRKILQSVELPAIPYVGVALTDLTFIQQGNPQNKGEVNLDMYLLSYKSISDVLYYQQSAYRFDVAEPIHFLIRAYPSLSEEDLYNLSVAIEPK